MTDEEAKNWFNNTRALSKEKQHRAAHQDVILSTSYLPECSSLPQRLWHIIHNTKVVPGCKICSTPVSWDKRYRLYKTYCGNPQCPNVDSVVNDKKRAHTDYNTSKSRRQQTNVNRYGHTNYLASTTGRIDAAKGWQHSKQRVAEQKQHLLQVRTETMTRRYGVKNFSHTHLSTQTLEYLNDPSWLYDQHYVQQKSLTHIAAELNVAGGATTIGQYLRKHGLATQTLPARSYGEKQLEETISSWGVSVITSDRTAIKPYELDIYIPSHSLAIEYCGLYWHSEQQGKNRQYHFTKYKRCLEAGIQLITMFEDEWVTKRDQVCRKLRTLLHTSVEPVIYARSCNLRDVNKQDRESFLNANHIQGDGSGSVTTGLYNAETLVALMTWKQTAPGVWLLNRYATSQRVVGGFSRLVTHFQRTQQWNQLVSFADNRWSDGGVYSNNGWTRESVLPPDYYYSPDGHTRIHKFNYRRKNLPTLLSTFDPTLSEAQNCFANNVLKIWDCGKQRFVINRS